MYLLASGVLATAQDFGTSAQFNASVAQINAGPGKLLGDTNVMLSADRSAAYAEFGTASGRPTNTPGAMPVVGTSDTYFVKYDTAGLTPQWTQTFGIPGKYCQSVAASFDGVGALIFSGNSNGNTTSMSGATTSNNGEEVYMRYITPGGVIH